MEYTLWYQLEDMFQLMVMPQGIEKVTIQLIDIPTKVSTRYLVSSGERDPYLV